MRKEDKIAVIAQLTELLKQYPHFYLVDVEGMNAADTSSLRRKCFEKGLKMVVVKNTLMIKALENLEENFDELKPLLYKSEHCESMEDVNDVIEHYEEWVRYPYENDTLVYQRLKRVPTAAYESLARSYKNRAKSQVERFFDWIGIGSGTKQYMDRMQQRFQEETSDLLESIDNLIDKLSDSKGNEETIRELQDTRRSLTDKQAP